jgi:hypothetical protein
VTDAVTPYLVAVAAAGSFVVSACGGSPASPARIPLPRPAPTGAAQGSTYAGPLTSVVTAVKLTDACLAVAQVGESDTTTVGLTVWNDAETDVPG